MTAVDTGWINDENPLESVGQFFLQQPVKYFVFGL
jgi:hypothetical protein